MLKQVLEHIIQVAIETRSNDMSESICEHCNKPIEFDIDCQEMVEMGKSTEACKWVHNECLEEYEMVSCDICGDRHDIDSIPLSCQTGDGE